MKLNTLDVTRLFLLLLSVSLLLAAPRPSAAETAQELADHYDAPQHGGVVLQYHDELHYELVVVKGGTELQVWMSDARRRPLAAASEISDLQVEIGHPGNKTDTINMRVSDDGGYWYGPVPPMNPQDIVRIGFKHHQTGVTSNIKYDLLLHPPKPNATSLTEALTTDHRYRVVMLLVPKPIPMNKLFEVELILFDGSDPQLRVTDATLKIEAGMTHGTKEFMHGMQTAPKIEAGEGSWKVRGMMFHMEGPWTLRVNVIAGGKTSTADLTLACCGSG